MFVCVHDRPRTNIAVRAQTTGRCTEYCTCAARVKLPSAGLSGTFACVWACARLCVHVRVRSCLGLWTVADGYTVRTENRRTVHECVRTKLCVSYMYLHRDTKLCSAASTRGYWYCMVTVLCPTLVNCTGTVLYMYVTILCPCARPDDRRFVTCTSEHSSAR